MKYIVKLKDTIVYHGYIEMSEEEYEKLCLEDEDIQINTVRNKFIVTDKREEEELKDFYPLH